MTTDIVRLQNNSDLVYRLYRVSPPARLGQMKNAADFRAPMHNVALFILYIEIQLAMGIHQPEFRHGSLQRDLLIHGVRRAGSVMREHRHRKRENTNNTNKNER